MLFGVDKIQCACRNIRKYSQDISSAHIPLEPILSRAFPLFHRSCVKASFCDKLESQLTINQGRIVYTLSTYPGSTATATNIIADGAAVIADCVLRFCVITEEIQTPGNTSQSPTIRTL